MINPRRAALQLFCFMAAFFVVWTIRATWVYSIDESIASPTGRAAYSNLLKLTLWVLPAVAFARWLRDTPPAAYLGLSVVPDHRSRWWCFVVTAVFLLVVALVELTVGGKSFSAARLSSLSVGSGLLQLLVSPLLEEILFRGLVMKELLTLLPTSLANALTSLLFVGAHLPFWLSHGGPSPAMLANATGVFLFSVVAGWLLAKSASVWPPTLAHVANNLLSSLLVVSKV